MRFLDRRDRTQCIHTQYESKGRTLQVVTGTGTGKVHVLRALNAHVIQHFADNRHDQFYFVQGARIAYAIRLNKRDNGYITHLSVSQFLPPERLAHRSA